MKNKIYRLLRKSEKYTKTDMVYLAKGGFWLTLGQGISAVSAFLLAIAFANLLPKEVYGTYKYALSIFGILAIPTLSGMGTAITRAVAQGRDGSFLPALKLKIHWGLFGALASLGLAGYYFAQGNTELTFVFLITAIFVPFMDSLALYGALLQGKKKFGISSRYGIWIKIIASLSIFVTLYFTRNLFAVLFVYFASYTFLRLVVLRLSLKFMENKKEDPEAISYGKHLSLMGVIGLVAANLDNILIFHYLGPVNLAIYSFARKPADQINGLLKPLSNLALPSFAQNNKENIKKTLPRKIKIYFLFTLILFIIYVLTAPFLFRILFPQYMDSVIFSQFLASSMLFAPFGLFATVMTSEKEQKRLYFYSISVSILRLLFLLVSVHFFGIWGAVATIIFKNIYSTIITYIFFRK